MAKSNENQLNELVKQVSDEKSVQVGIKSAVSVAKTLVQDDDFKDTPIVKIIKSIFD
jgi:hypothetical protein